MEELDHKKKHNKRHSGRKADKKNKKGEKPDGIENAKQNNPKAFAIQSHVKAERRFRRTMDVKSKRQQMPTVDRTPMEPPPIVVAIVGPPKVGKTTLLRCLIKNFTHQNVKNVQGPFTVVSGKKRRLTFLECNNDINVMVDVAKIADLVLLMIDAKFGFEMETFEFLNVCQVHGFPRILGVLTHLDLFRNAKQLRTTKKQLKHRFWTEIYQGAKLFYLSGMIHDEYQKTEVHNLGRFISVIKFRPLQWRTTHPYLLADRMEDITDPETIRQNPKCDREISLYGYVRGTYFKNHSNIHIPGCGDFYIKDMKFLPDPCPLPDKEKRRSLNEKERLIFAPMSGVGGIIYDKDAVYIDLGGSHSHTKTNLNEEEKADKELTTSLMAMQATVDTKLAQSKIQMFKGAPELGEEDVAEWEQIKDESENLMEHSGRRKVRFADEKNESDDDDDDNEEEKEDDDDEDDEEEEENEDDNDDDEEENYLNYSNDDESHNEKIQWESDDEEPVRKRFKADDENEYDDDDDEEVGHLKWKDDLAKKASDLYYKHQNVTRNLQKLIYGTRTDKEKLKDDDEDKNEKEIEDFFYIARDKSEIVSERMSAVKEDSRFKCQSKHDWSLTEARDEIRDEFVTGKWREDEDARALLEQDDEDLYGDFEDLETGKKHDASEMDEEKEDDIIDDVKLKAEPKTTLEKRMEKKRKLKELFDGEYDDKSGGSAYLDGLKSETDLQTQLNRSEFEGLPDEIRVQYEGFRPGMYVRVFLENIPCEMVTNFDPTYPIMLGGLLSAEENIGFVQVRIKKHRWYKRILKTRDPLIFSLGWRRFQTLVLFSTRDDNGRNRVVKYTPEHLHCNASFWGPITPPGTGLLAFQSVSEATPNFRIAATGVILNLDKSTQLVKKLKLIGEPSQIFKKTSFIKGMFSSCLEVAKFEGASIKTVSGIRGQIKKALRKPEGAFRATFEDRIKMSDIVFMRTWFTVDVPKFYNPVTSLLLPPEMKSKWQGMRTVGQLRKAYGIQAPLNENSIYKPIEREERVFGSLRIPKSLQKNLPYALKPKFAAKMKGVQNLQAQRIAVIREPEEEKVARLLKTIKGMYAAKKVKDKVAMSKRVEKHRKQVKQQEEIRMRKQKEVKRQICRTLHQMEQKKLRQNAKKNDSRDK